MVWHQDVAVEQKAQPSSRPFQCLHQKWVFGSYQRVKLTKEVDSDEEDAVRETQATNVRHAEKPTVRKGTDRGYRKTHGQKSPDRGYRLEVELPAELEYSSRIRGDHATESRVIDIRDHASNIVGGLVGPGGELRMVESVEGLYPQLDVFGLCNVDVLEQRNVEIIDSGPVERIPEEFPIPVPAAAMEKASGLNQ